MVFFVVTTNYSMDYILYNSWYLCASISLEYMLKSKTTGS